MLVLFFSRKGLFFRKKMDGRDLVVPKKGDKKIKIPPLGIIQCNPFKVIKKAVLHGFYRFNRGKFRIIF